MEMAFVFSCVMLAFFGVGGIIEVSLRYINNDWEN